jgi:hypothetical protein
MPSPNFSSRGGATVRAVILHTAQGADTARELGNFFANPSSGVSSHVGIDDNEVCEYVLPQYKAWTAAGANPWAIQAELTGWAEWSAADWAGHPGMLSQAAQWVGEECARFSIPLRVLGEGEAEAGAAGVCQHADLGPATDNNHWDCGPGFPIHDVVAMAQGGVGAAPTKRKGRKMIAGTGGDGYWTVTSDGAVYAFGNAEHKGGANTPDVTQPGVEIIGIAGDGTTAGYWLYGSDGSIFAFGSAQFHGRPDRA